MVIVMLTLFCYVKQGFDGSKEKKNDNNITKFLDDEDIDNIAQRSVLRMIVSN